MEKTDDVKRSRMNLINVSFPLEEKILRVSWQKSVELVALLQPWLSAEGLLMFYETAFKANLTDPLEKPGLEREKTTKPKVDPEVHFLHLPDLVWILVVQGDQWHHS